VKQDNATNVKNREKNSRLDTIRTEMWRVSDEVK